MARWPETQTRIPIAYPRATPTEIIKNARISQSLSGPLWTRGNATTSSVEVLRLLHAHGVIGAKVRRQLKDAQELRNDVQHDYANVGARRMREAVLLVLDSAPVLVQEAALALR